MPEPRAALTQIRAAKDDYDAELRSIAEARDALTHRDRTAEARLVQQIEVARNHAGLTITQLAAQSRELGHEQDDYLRRYLELIEGTTFDGSRMLRAMKAVMDVLGTQAEKR